MKSQFPIFRRDSTLKLQIAILDSLHFDALYHEQHCWNYSWKVSQESLLQRLIRLLYINVVADVLDR